MKIHGKLPNSKDFVPIESSTLGLYLWRDRQTAAIVIRSPDPDPWEKNWDILFSAQKQKADRSEYPYRMQLRLYSSSKGQLAVIDREWIKGVFASSNRANLKFIALTITSKNSIPEWITYTIYAQ
jgi:hypothetical protein